MTIRRALLTACCVLGFMSTSCTFAMAANAAQDELKPMEVPIPLTVYQVKKNLGAENLYIFDCNPKEIYERSHIPGAISINRGDWQSVLPADKKNSYLVFYCINKLCGISREVADRVLKLGYYNVYLMPDGINGWTGHGFEFEGTGRIDPAMQKSRFSPYGKTEDDQKSPVMPELNRMNNP